MFKKIAFIIIVVFAAIVSWAAQSPQVPLPATAIPQFVDELPSLYAILAGTSQIELQMTEFKFNMLPAGTVPGYTGTWVWSYLTPAQAAAPATVPSYINPVILAARGTPTEIKFVNNLSTGATTNVLAWKYSTDQTMHWADPLGGEQNFWSKYVKSGNALTPADAGAQNYAGPIPSVVHLHGGEVPPVLDGGPDGWVASDGMYWGHGYYTMGGTQGGPAPGNWFIYRYPNSQEASPIWFHPHDLGITRLNVYAGLAGAYVIIDPPNDPANLPAGRAAYGEPLIPMVIQDRRFDTNGQLFFPADSAGGILWSINPEHPYWVPEFDGDAIVVNGKAWPTVGTAAAPLEAKRYRFLFLNGSNARTYELYIINALKDKQRPVMWVIGNDGGYLDVPQKVADKLTIMPGERYDVIIDFAGFANTTLIMRNSARHPYNKGVTPNGNTTGRIAQFIIGAAPAGGDTSYDPSKGLPLRAPMKRLTNPVTGTLAPGVVPNVTRQLTLNEVMGPPQIVTDPVTGVVTAYPGGPLEVLMNNTTWDGTRWNAVAGAFEPIPGASVPAGHPPIPGGGFPEYYYTEFSNEGDTEVWEIVNTTADAHPIHLHLVQFQIMNRQNYQTSKYATVYNAAFPGAAYIGGYGPPLDYFTGNPRALGGNPDITPYLQGLPMPPLATEAGWKDTAISYPAQVLRLAVRWCPTDVAIGDTVNNHYPFDPNGGHGYVWHCHIIDHEDNEMMRPNSINPKPGAPRTYIQTVDY